jgi:hypothetical protein
MSCFINVECSQSAWGASEGIGGRKHIQLWIRLPEGHEAVVTSFEARLNIPLQRSAPVGLTFDRSKATRIPKRVR